MGNSGGALKEQWTMRAYRSEPPGVWRLAGVEPEPCLEGKVGGGVFVKYPIVGGHPEELMPKLTSPNRNGRTNVRAARGPFPLYHESLLTD